MVGAAGVEYRLNATAGGLSAQSPIYLIDTYSTNGGIYITSGPSGAAIAIDGLDLAEVTPFWIEKAPGDYSVEVSLAGYATPAAQTASVEAGNTTNIDFELSLIANIPPVADDLSVSLDEDTSTAITLTGSDPDSGDTLTYTVITSPATGC